MKLQVDGGQVEQELQELAAFSDTKAPAITRVAFNEVDIAARAWLKQKCLSAGLTVREDAVGNLFARWQGEDQTAGVVGTGSHIDAIPNSGRYDGTVGVLGGLEAIRALQRSGYRPLRSIELIMFTSEEPTRFGIGCLGSRLLAGALESAAAARLKDDSDRDLAKVLEKAGFYGDLNSVRLKPGDYSSFVELHIEQGPLLEEKDVSIGIVTGIAAPASLRVQIEGQGGHAGTVLMRDRADAFTGAAEIALYVEAVALGTGSADSVTTTGVCRVFPGAVNSVPSGALLEIDVRDVDLARRDGMIGKVLEGCSRVGQRRNLSVQMEVLNSDAPVQCSAAVINASRQACQDLGFSEIPMVSRAYHDSLFMSVLAPVGMIFIPCRKGMSHRPEEFASPQAIADGVAVLAGTLAKLAG